MAEDGSTELIYVPEFVAFKPEEVASAYAKARNKVFIDGYKKDKYGNTVGENLMRLMDWVEDPKAVRLEEERQTQRTLKNFFDTYGTFFADLSDRLLYEKDDPEFKLQWAKFNQQLAQDMVVAYQLQDDDMLEGMQLFAEVVDKVADKDDTAFKKIEWLLNGAKCQAAMMNFFTENGCLVLAPDPENDEEIHEIDATNATDFLVIRQDGLVILIDMKSKEEFQTKQDFNPRSGDFVYNSMLPGVLASYEKNVPNSKYKANISQYDKRRIGQEIKVVHLEVSLNPTKIDDKGKMDLATEKLVYERFFK